MNDFLFWLAPIAAIAFVIGGNLWFFYGFYDRNTSKVIEEDCENVPGDFE